MCRGARGGLQIDEAANVGLQISQQATLKEWKMILLVEVEFEIPRNSENLEKTKYLPFY